MSVDLLVIGAGPTGLTAAAEALRLGLSVRIVDRKAHRSTFSKALVVHARTLEALDGLGIAGRLVAEGARFEALNLHFGPRAPVRVDLGALDWGDARFPFWLSIPQYATERLLEERLLELGGAVEWGTSLVGLSQHGEGVTARLRDAGGAEEECGSRWLLGADGGRSRTRELVGIGMDRESLAQTFVLADVKTRCDLTPTEGHVWHAEQGLLLIVPMPEPGVFRIIAHAPELGPEDRVELDAGYFDRMLLERAGLEFGSHDLAWSSQFVLSQGLSARYRAGRVFLAGDAAHVHSPVGGQGMNTGIQDAHNLLWKLALARDLGEAAEPFLQSYEQERRPVAQAMVQGTGRATRVLGTTHPLLRPLLGAVGSRVAAWDRVQQMLGRGVGMLDVGYGASAILPTGGRRGAVGERLPDPELVTGRLHGLLHPAGHTLIDLDGGRVSGLGGSQQLDHDDAGALRATLGSGQLLVRPDGIVAGLWPDLESLVAFGPAATAVRPLRP